MTIFFGQSQSSDDSQSVLYIFSETYLFTTWVHPFNSNLSFPALKHWANHLNGGDCSLWVRNPSCCDKLISGLNDLRSTMNWLSLLFSNSVVKWNSQQIAYNLMRVDSMLSEVYQRNFVLGKEIWRLRARSGDFESILFQFPNYCVKKNFFSLSFDEIFTAIDWICRPLEKERCILLIHFFVGQRVLRVSFPDANGNIYPGKI